MSCIWQTRKSKFNDKSKQHDVSKKFLHLYTSHHSAEKSSLNCKNTSSPSLFRWGALEKWSLAFDTVFSPHAFEKWKAFEEIDGFSGMSGPLVMDDETERNRNTRNSNVTTGTNYKIERWNFNGKDIVTVVVFQMRRVYGLCSRRH